MQVEQKPKIGRKKDAYIAQPLPTENNLVTEEGFSNSFHFYGTHDNRKSNRYHNKDNEIVDEDLNDFIKSYAQNK